MSDLVEQEVKNLDELSVNQRERLIKLTNKIYTLESACQSMSTQKITEDIMSEISFASDLWKEKGN